MSLSICIPLHQENFRFSRLSDKLDILYSFLWQLNGSESLFTAIYLSKIKHILLLFDFWYFFCHKALKGKQGNRNQNVYTNIWRQLGSFPPLSPIRRQFKGLHFCKRLFFSLNGFGIMTRDWLFESNICVWSTLKETFSTIFSFSYQKQIVMITVRESNQDALFLVCNTCS